MQENEAIVGWDPNTCCREIGWMGRIYILYLFFILCLALARSIKVGWQLWGYWSTSSSPFRDLRQATLELVSSTPTQVSDKLLRAFDHQWKICTHNVKSMKRTVILTGIYAGAMAAGGLSNVFREISYAKATGWGAIGGGVSEVVVMLSLGLSVCVIIYAVAIFLEGRLESRKIRWEYKFAEKRLSSTKN
jgi:hypothetical protein